MAAAFLALTACQHKDAGEQHAGRIIGMRVVSNCNRITLVDKFNRIEYDCINLRSWNSYSIGDKYP